MKAHEILRIIQKRHQPEKELFLTNVKTGETYDNPNLKILDAVAIKRSWRNPCIVAYEIKVDRQDFLRDTKWPSYLEYCHKFFFACPNELIRKEEIVDSTVGFIWIDQEKNGKLSVKKQAVFRNINLPYDMFYHLVISHMKTDQHPFFSETRDYLEAWVKDKGDRADMAYYVKTKMGKVLHEQETENVVLKKEIASLKATVNQYEEVKAIMAEYGVDVGWNMKNNLRYRFEQGIDNNLHHRLQDARKAIDSILNRMEISHEELC